MKPLIVLLAVFTLCLFAIRITNGEYELATSAKIAMAAMLIFTSIAHFAFNKGMSMMLPDFIPYKNELVYLTGIMEMAFAIGLFIPDLRIITAWLLIAFFILMLPANIYASMKHVNYQKATFDGNGLKYLWFRIPLQIFFIAWTYLSSIKY